MGNAGFISSAVTSSLATKCLNGPQTGKSSGSFTGIHWAFGFRSSVRFPDPSLASGFGFNVLRFRVGLRVQSESRRLSGYKDPSPDSNHWHGDPRHCSCRYLRPLGLRPKGGKRCHVGPKYLLTSNILVVFRAPVVNNPKPHKPLNQTTYLSQGLS